MEASTKKINYTAEKIKAVLIIAGFAIWAIAIFWLCFSISQKTFYVFNYSPEALVAFSVMLAAVLILQIGVTINMLIFIHDKSGKVI